MSSPPIKSTITVSNEQRSSSSSNPTPSSRTVVESVSISNDQSGNDYLLSMTIFFICKHNLDRRLISSDRKQVKKVTLHFFSYIKAFIFLL